MINLKFGLFWSGCKLSYLRYLTSKTLRHYHPDSEIELYTTDKFRTDGYSWDVEKQDFELENDGKDYMDDLKYLDVKILPCNQFEDYAPNYQSDFFRWWWLKDNSGFYLDTDQIILKPFDSLPLGYDLIFTGYKALSCGFYTPVGVIGSNKHKIVDYINALLPQFYTAKNYNSLGPFMFHHVLNMEAEKLKRLVNVPSRWFYPVPESYQIIEAYRGECEVPDDSYAFHWFGGHPFSQQFNKVYTEEYAQKSKDTISKTLREKGII